jgi:probable rRNA maturation factor
LRVERSETNKITFIDEQTVPVDGAHLRRLASHVLTRLEVPSELELTITCADRARITELNETYLDGTGATDVLAFPIDAPDEVVPGVPGMLGDVVVCPDVAAAQSAEHGRTPAEEIDLLLVHGILHLLGHDHAESDERAQMFGLTDVLLSEFTAASVP